MCLFQGTHFVRCSRETRRQTRILFGGGGTLRKGTPTYYSATGIPDSETRAIHEDCIGLGKLHEIRGDLNSATQAIFVLFHDYFCEESAWKGMKSFFLASSSSFGMP